MASCSILRACSLIRLFAFHRRPLCYPGEFYIHPLASVLPLFTRLPGRCQLVEKVVVGPVGGPKHPRTQAKTLQYRGLNPLNRGQKRAHGSFSTSWGVLGSSLSSGA